MNGHEWLGLWYLRLNGYFTLPNFMAHRRGGPLTEVDVLGIRLPHSQEFEDDPKLNISKDRADIVFAEAKGKKIETLNGPWGSPEGGALEYVLKRVGVVPAAAVEELAAHLYAKRAAEIDGYRIRIVCFANEVSEQLINEGVTFIPWAAAVDFIRKRFHQNAKLKRDHEAWDEFGKYLWYTIMNGADADQLFHGWDTHFRRRETELDKARTRGTRIT